MYIYLPSLPLELYQYLWRNSLLEKDQGTVLKSAFFLYIFLLHFLVLLTLVYFLSLLLKSVDWWSSNVIIDNIDNSWFVNPLIRISYDIYLNLRSIEKSNLLFHRVESSMTSGSLKCKFDYSLRICLSQYGLPKY